MANNTSRIKQRIESIQSTQKITQAMKLVSLSKLQTYRKKMLEFEAYFEAVDYASKRFVPMEASQKDLPKLYLIFMPDLGLCSAYTQGLMKEVQRVMDPKKDLLFSYGTQAYDSLRKRNLKIENEEVSSERLRLVDVVEDVQDYLEDYLIVAIVPEYEKSVELSFNHYSLKTKVKEPFDDVVYDPDFERVSQNLIRQSLNSLIQYSFLVSKVSEHTTRRIAMEKATDSAQEMIDDLQLKFNKARQEAITQEIAEIVSGMEV